NVALTIPIGSGYPVSPSFSYGLTLVYNSKAWDQELVAGRLRAVPNRQSNAGMGWQLSLGRLITPEDPKNDYDSFHWVYLAPDGSDHLFYSDLHGVTPGVDACTNATCYSRDGSYLRLRRLSASQKVLEFPNGERHLYERVGTSDQWRITALGDRFSPSATEPASIDDLTIDYNTANTWRLEDRHGRLQIITFEPDPSTRVPLRVKEVSFTAPPDAQGNPRAAIWTFGYGDLQTLQPSCSNGDPNWTSLTTSLLRSVTLPDGSGWAFTYHSNDGGGSCFSRGAIAAVTRPSGGSIEYLYGQNVLPVFGCTVQEWQTHSARVVTRIFKNVGGGETGRFTYASSLSQPPPFLLPPDRCTPSVFESSPSEELTVTVTTPLKDQQKHYFSVFPGTQTPTASTYDLREYGLPFTRLQPTQGGRFLSSVVSDCADDGSACVGKRERYVSFERDAAIFCNVPYGPDCPNTNRRLVGERTRYLDDIENPNTTPVTYRYADVARSGFDGLGHYRTATTGGNFGQADTATTFTNWNPGSSSTTTPPLGSPWVLDTYIERRTTEGISTVVQQACFDPTTGFLRRIRTLAGTTPQSKDLLTEWIPDVHGQATSERQYGGDLDDTL
ncbi:MAG: hypothetical protein SF066_14780, partial [Thermoanaerobaculia bacterium]|nr:hypothetical protein [Thermoanaerobaculia bacterium]